MVDLDKPMLPIEAVRPISSFGILGRIEAYRVQCPLHGSWMFPPGVVRTARSFALSHAACVAPAPEPELRGRASRPPARKDRRRFPIGCDRPHLPMVPLVPLRPEPNDPLADLLAPRWDRRAESSLFRLPWRNA